MTLLFFIQYESIKNILLSMEDTFELPEHFSESIGTVWKLLKVSVEVKVFCFTHLP